MRFPAFGLCVALSLFAASGAQAAELLVTNTNDSGAGSLRQAIQNANPAGGDTIAFQISTTDPNYNAATQVFAIPVNNAELQITKSLTIDGGLQKIVLIRLGFATGRLFNVTAGVVTLANLTISQGYSTSGGGGGIRNAATLLVRGCTLTDNQGVDQGGGIYNAAGATLTVENCTVTNNTLRATSDFGGSGAGIYNIGSLIVRDSTIAGNSSITEQGKNIGSNGGGILNANPGTARILNTIVTSNTARFGWNAWGAFISDGYNMVSIPADGNTGFGATGDQLGLSEAQINLGLLHDNGGPTPTMRPQAGSFAIDAGKRGVDANNLPVNTDQRGYPRPVDFPGIPNATDGDGSDIGAVETGPLQLGPTFVVTTTTSTGGSPGCTADECSLHEALNAANADGDHNTITFSPDAYGEINSSNVSSLGYSFSTPVTLIGPGAHLLTITGQGTTRVLQVSSPDVVISGLTLANGSGFFGNDGGAIFNTGHLTLRDCEVRNNVAVHNATFGGGNGGGLFNASGATAILERCTFNLNSAQQFGGGAVFNVGTLTATNCTFANNTAPAGGGILSVADNGNSLTTLRNCTITGNTATATGSATSGGGGYYGEGAIGNSLHHFSNTILAGNTNANNPDLRGYGTTEGNNLIGNLGQGGSGFTNGVNGDKVGVSAGLGLLASNGGSTDTCSLLAGSPAINAGNNALAPPTDQRGFGRNGVSDIGAFEFNGVPPPVPIASAFSRKIHGNSGPFDINLPFTNPPGIECRTGEAGGNYTVLFNFTNTLATVASAAVTSGTGFVSSSNLGSDFHQYVVNLSGITNAQRVTVTLSNVTDSLGSNSAAIPVTVGFLLGDTTDNGSVSSTDISQTKAQSGQPVGPSNFRTDVTANGGTINASDISQVKSQSGTQLP